MLRRRRAVQCCMGGAPLTWGSRPGPPASCFRFLRSWIQFSVSTYPVEKTVKGKRVLQHLCLYPGVLRLTHKTMSGGSQSDSTVDIYEVNFGTVKPLQCVSMTLSIQSSVVLCSCPSPSMMRPKTEPSLSPGIPSGVSRQGSTMDGTTAEARPSTNPLQQHPAQLLPQPPKKHPQDFKFRKILGKGSFSTVVLAQELATSRDYAIKILEKRHIIKENKVPYVTRERDVVIPQSSLLCETLYFKNTKSLSYTKNGELLKYISKFGSFDETCIHFYIAEIVSALQNLHGKDIIHRDLNQKTFC